MPGGTIVIGHSSGSQAEVQWQDQDALLSIGRDPKCDIVLDDLDVSRRHATVQPTANGWLVVDRSSNGTYVGDDYVRHRGVRVQGEILARIGPFSLRLPHHRQPQGTQPSRSGAGAPASVRREIHRRLLDNLELASLDRDRMDAGIMRPRVVEALQHIVADMGGDLGANVDRDGLIGELVDEVLGLGPLEPLLGDDSVSEIMVVDADTIFCERLGRIEKTSHRFTDDEAVRSAIERIIAPLGRRIDESTPYVDARLKDGSRVNAAIAPIALRGACITIRKFGKKAFTMEDLVGFGSLTERMAQFLQRCVEGRKNIVIAGGTGSGKTTLLNVLSSQISGDERIVTIEDAAELRLGQEHVVSLESRPPNMEGNGEIPIRQLVRNALRMRPDRIIVGECRGGEALDMLQAMNTGHDGSMTTTHANSPREAVLRLETLALMSGLDLPARAIREQLATSVDVLVQQNRLSDGTRRITSISEVVGLDDDGNVEILELFRFQQNGVGQGGHVIGSFQASGYLPNFLSDLIARGLIPDGEYL